MLSCDFRAHDIVVNGAIALRGLNRRVNPRKLMEKPSLKVDCYERLHLETGRVGPRHQFFVVVGTPRKGGGECQVPRDLAGGLLSDRPTEWSKKPLVLVLVLMFPMTVRFDFLRHDSRDDKARATDALHLILM